jgi:hypothetical protein
MPSQEPISPGQIKPESSREPQISSRLQQTNVKLQAPPKSEESYTEDGSTLRSSATEDGLALSIGAVPSKAGATSAHSKRFAQSGCALAAVRLHPSRTTVPKDFRSPRKLLDLM